MITWKRALAPLTLCVLAATTLVGCNASFSVGRTRYYNDRVWNSDPWCRYNYNDYDNNYCNYGHNDGYRVRIIFGNRYPGYRYGGGWRSVEGVTAARQPAQSWQQEFGLNANAVQYLRVAFDNALQGSTDALERIGVDRGDIARLGNLQMPSSASIQRAARNLGVRSHDMRDFLEMYLIRMKTALNSQR